MTEPTDTAIDTLILEHGVMGQAWPTQRQLHAFARAVLAKWGTPAPVGVEPVAEVRTIHGVTLGYLHESQPDGTKLYTADQVLAMRRVPLDRDEIRTYARETLGDVAEEAGFYDGVRWAEEKHGIKQGGQHGADI